MPERSPRRLTRADLPAELTAEALSGLGFGTLRRLADHRNGVLDAADQKQFDAALAEVMRGTASRLNETLERARRPSPGSLDPALRRSYQRAQQRLDEQARRARRNFPELPLDGSAVTPEPTPSDDGPEGGTATSAQDEDVSPTTLEQEVEQTSETLDMLERIASLQQQQLDHQESQLLTDTRGLFFAFLVSVTVIIAGVAPLVEAEPHARVLILLWTAGVILAAGLVYLLVRRVQRTT